MIFLIFHMRRQYLTKLYGYTPRWANFRLQFTKTLLTLCLLVRYSSSQKSLPKTLYSRLSTKRVNPSLCQSKRVNALHIPPGGAYQSWVGRLNLFPVVLMCFFLLLARYWSNPEEFRPERFLGDWPRNAYARFSMGTRSCIGRR